MSTLSTPSRASGILAHITSLPGPYGIGDMGPDTYDFLHYLNRCGQQYLQILPTGPTSTLFDNSPYMSTSAFAGSPLLISPTLLHQDGLIDKRWLTPPTSFSPYTVNFAEVTQWKRQLLAKAFAHFTPAGTDYKRFIKNTGWLEEYCLYMALKEKYNKKPWVEWPRDVAGRTPNVIKNARQELAERLDYFRFEQFIFSRQWQQLRRQAASEDILLIGDIPIYVGYDSADVWAHQQIFTLHHKTGRPTHVSGVPPDYFSDTGQRWGNPLYRWHARDKTVRTQLLDWWTERFRAVFTQVDVARIDHFRGFESYWSIPAHHETAMNGKWLKGPGKSFFNQIFTRLGKLDIIAEDLGIITPAVTELRDALHLPGMKVLQFAFDGNPKNSFLPQNYTTPDCVVYTGTHDNDTSVGWFLSGKLTDRDRSAIKLMANGHMQDQQPIHQDLIYLALSSIAKLAIFPLQDILGYGNDCKMNTPSTSTGNWRWRCPREVLNGDVAHWLREQTHRFGRTKEEQKEKNSTTNP